MQENANTNNTNVTNQVVDPSSFASITPPGVL